MPRGTSGTTWVAAKGLSADLLRQSGRLRRIPTHEITRIVAALPPIVTIASFQARQGLEISCTSERP